METLSWRTAGRDLDRKALRFLNRKTHARKIERPLSDVGRPQHPFPVGPQRRLVAFLLRYEVEEGRRTRQEQRHRHQIRFGLCGKWIRSHRLRSVRERLPV